MPAFVQNAGSGTTGTTVGPAFASNTTTGNNIIVIIGYPISNPIQYSTSVSDGTNTYQNLLSYGSGTNGIIEVWVAYNITGAVTPTVTVNIIKSNIFCVSITEVSGCAIGQPIDFLATNTRIGVITNTKFAMDTPGFKTPNNFVMFASPNPTASTWVVGPGYSNLQNVVSGTLTLGVESQVIASKNAITSSMTNVGGQNQNAPMLVLVMSDTNLPPFKRALGENNYQFMRVSDGMSVSEKIR